MRALILAAAVMLAATPAPGTEPAADADDPAISIEVGRFGVMLDQVEAARNLLVGHGVRMAAVEGPQGSVYDILVATVLRFNALADRACREIDLPAADCAGPIRPVWISAPPSDSSHLRVMIDEAGDRITAFWGDVCVLAKAKTGKDHLCDIE